MAFSIFVFCIFFCFVFWILDLYFTFHDVFVLNHKKSPYEREKNLHVFSNCLQNLIIQEQTPFDDVNPFHEGYFICANFTFLDKVPPIFLCMCFFSFTFPRGKEIGVDPLE